MNDRVPISPESKAILVKETFLNIEVFSKVVDDIRRSIQLINVNCSKLKEIDGSYEISNETISLIRLSEYLLLIGLIWLDITSALRVYLKAELNYEVLYSSKQLIVTINEGYKKIYSFVNLKNGKENFENRNDSFWMKDIGTLIIQSLISLQPQYNEITTNLEDYLKEHFDDIKTNRGFFVHYDKEPSKVYDSLTALDIEVVFQKVIPFINILTKMFEFTKLILVEFNKFNDEKNNVFFDNYIQKFEALKQNNTANNQGNDFIDEIKTQLNKFKKL